MANLIPDVWIDYLIGDEDEFFKNDRFLSHGKNVSAFVENDFINFAYKGGRPGITKNFNTNGTTQLPVFLRTDVPDKVQLDDYSTDQMVIPFKDMQLLPYDKKMSMMEDARMALIAEIAKEGMWKIGAVNSAKTPVLTTASTNTNGADGYEQLIRADFIRLRKALDAAYPGKANMTYWAVVDVDAYWDLITNDSILNAQWGYMLQAGKVFALNELPVVNIAGFNLYADNRTPWYTNVTTKLAYGATITPGTHLKSAIFYADQESFFNALGSTELFDQNRHPGMQADLASFRTRAFVGPFGQTTANYKHVAAILRTVNA